MEIQRVSLKQGMYICQHILTVSTDIEVQTVRWNQQWYHKINSCDVWS